VRKTIGIAALLLIVILVTSAININFVSPFNIRNILRWTGLFGLLSLGEALVVITGGIDLSVGSITGLVGSLLPLMLSEYGISVGLALMICFAITLAIGLIHGLLVTRLKMQPFIVTLCGLFIYRGLARYITKDVTQSFGQGYLDLKFISQGLVPSNFWKGSAEVPRFINNWSLPMPFIFMIVMAFLLWIILHRSVYGRYLFALGRNEKAARFSGINTNRMTMTAYVLSALLSGLAAVLFSLNINGSQPSSQGIFYELYAIAGAVLGGCSLRGGEGNVVGIILGTAIVRVLYNVINILGIATQLEYAVVGVVILGGVAVDDILKIYTERRLVRSKVTRELADFQKGQNSK
jgi:ribose transport system permease protein